MWLYSIAAIQDHLWSTALLTRWTESPSRCCLLTDLNICAVQVHWWTPFSRSSSVPMVLTQAVSPGRPEWMCRGSPASDECPLQDSLLRTTLFTHSVLSSSRWCILRDLNKCADDSLSQWWMPFTRPSSKWAYCIDPTSSVSQET